MGVRVTSTEKKQALFDSVTDTAFGPIFNEWEDVDDFLTWLEDRDGRDARIIPSDELASLQSEWHRLNPWE